MKRERKHRVWNGLEMVYDVMVGKFGVFYVNPGKDGKGLDERDSASLTPFNTIFSEGTPVMDFTGLHDKNGKEIYEGDVVQFEYQNGGGLTPDARAEVTFSLGAFNVWGDRLSDYFVEVVGNIYENPELLT